MKYIGKIIVILTTFLFLMMNSEAQSVHIKMGDSIPESRIGVYAKNSQVLRMIFKTIKNDEDLLYITDPFSVQYSADYQEIEDLNLVYVNLTEEELQLISKIMYFGYGYKDRLDMKWYVATQVVIWESLLDNNARFVFSAENTITFDEEIATLKADVAKYDMKPSFLGNQRSVNNYQLNVGQELIFADRNDVMDNFEVVPQDNMVVNIKNNVMRISFTKSGTYKVSLRPKVEKLNKDVNIYSNGKYVVLERGDIMEDITLGEFEVQPNKVNVGFDLNADEKTFPLKGTSYGVFNDTEEMVETLVFEDNERLELLLEPGKYYLKQLNAPYGYKNSTKKISFNVLDTNLEVLIPLTLDKKSVIIKTPIAQSLKLFTKAGDLVLAWDQEAGEAKQLKLAYGDYILSGDNITEVSFNIDTNTSTKTITVKEKIEDLEPDIPSLEVKMGSLIIKNICKDTGELQNDLIRVKIKNKNTGEYVKINNEEILNIEHGSLELEDLEVGEYVLLNIDGFDNFKIIPEIEFVVQEGSNELINYWEMKKGFLIIKKIDRVTKESIKDSLIGIYNENKELIKEVKTNEDGIIELDLPVGIYFIKDLLNTSDYELNEEEIEIQVKDNIKSVLTISNRMKVNVPKTSVNDGFLVPILSSGLFLLGFTLKKYGQVN